MCRYAHVASGPRQALVLTVRYVFLGVRVDVLLCQPEVDDVDYVLVLHAQPPDQEILWFYVAVDQLSTVDYLYPLKLKRWNV